MTRRSYSLAWVIQFGIGFFIGGAVGIACNWGRHVYSNRHWLRSDLVLPFALGTALLGAGVATYNADRVRVGEDVHIRVAVESPGLRIVLRIVSVLTGC